MNSDIYAIQSSRDILLTFNDSQKSKPRKQSSGISGVIREEYGRMVQYVRNKLKDAAQQDAEDIVQDVFYSIINRTDITAPVENIVSYLYQSLRNRIVDFWRKRKKNESLDSDRDNEQQITLLDILSDNRYSADEDVNRREMKFLLKEALSQLNSEERSVIIATEIHDYSFIELSELWNIPLNTLLSRKARAMKKIQAWIKNQSYAGRDFKGN